MAEEREPAGRLIRPYTMTGGRTGAELPPIELEALVESTSVGVESRSRFRWEAAEILDLSARPTALVELSARLEVPIGVIRVVVADLAKRGAVTITSPQPVEEVAANGTEYTDLLRKVLDGIKSL